MKKLMKKLLSVFCRDDISPLYPVWNKKIRSGQNKLNLSHTIVSKHFLEHFPVWDEDKASDNLIIIE